MNSRVPCDTGYSWVVMIGTSICMFFVVGMFRSQGILFVEFIDAFGSSQALSAWMVGVTACGLSLISPVANYLAVKYSSRVVVMFGSVLVALGALLTAWAPNIYFVICVFGILTGCGYSCMFGPSLMMIGFYFEKRRSFANALALAGASLGCLIIPPVMTVLIENYTVWGALILYSAIVLHGCVAALLLRPPAFYTRKRAAGVVAPPHIVTVSTDASDRLLPSKDDTQLPECAVLRSPIQQRLLKSHLCVSNPQLSRNTTPLSITPINTTPLNSSMNDLEKHSGNKQSVHNKNLLLLQRMDDHYTSKESLFIVEGQEIPVKMVQEELRLKCTLDSQALALDEAEQERKACSNVPFLRVCCQIFSWEHFENPLFILFCISVGVGNSAYVDHFILVPPHSEDLGFSKDRAAVLLSIAGGLDILGRISSGYFADLNLVARWRIMSIAMMITGTSTTVCSFFKVYPAVVVLCAVLGFVSGVQVSLFTVVLVDFVGLNKFPGAFGVFMLVLGVFNSGLPSCLGYLRDVTGSHQASFFTIGVLMVMSGAVLWLEPCARRYQDRRHKHT